jgi:hypothetical protein
VTRVKLEIATEDHTRYEELRVRLVAAAKHAEGPGHVTRMDDQFTWIIVETPAKR